jgi:ribonuclease H2 subunit A
VLGPMTYSAAFAPLEDDLKSKDFNDSKQLTEAKRDQLFSSILRDERMGFAVENISAQYISGLMLARSKVSLNKIAEDSTMRIIQRVLDAGVNLQQVFVDTVGDAGRYDRLLSQRFPQIKFTVCPKADAIYPIVSAASIVAKVIRDHSLIASCKIEGLPSNTGSGYPGDPLTVQLLKSNIHRVLGFPKVVRFSWETVTRMLKDHGALTIEFESDADSQNEQQRLSFGSSTSKAMVESSGVGRHLFYRTRKLQRVNEAF